MNLKYFFLFIFLINLSILSPALAQQKDTVKTEKKTSTGPKRAAPSRVALMSAVVPGLGQIYNKKYWKLPIVYGGGGALIYWFSYSRTKFLAYRDAYNQYPGPYTGNALKSGVDISQFDQQTMRFYRDDYRRQTELSILLMITLYSLNIVDAYVDAHLKGFDADNNLSFSVKPFLYQNNYSQFATGLTLNLHLRK